ncbi:hypothetical protein [Agaribacterium haliotis]|uniref:hypothetical protein n=1 Tax=Agaribacterium haliotis TaxID=2013869 RepID=UPI000BB556B6|nr:hypothetical protein [Agaribacterium haliotis]
MLRPALILSLLFSLSACHEAYYYQESSYVEHGYSEQHPDQHGSSSSDHQYPGSTEAPRLISFNLVDSYQNASEQQHTLSISPYIDDGLFETNWQVDSSERHRVELFINNRASLESALRLSSSWCGPNQDCGWDSYQYCYYQQDFSVQCELPQNTELQPAVDTSILFEQLPESLYLILEICDSELFYCEYRSQPLSFE